MTLHVFILTASCTSFVHCYRHCYRPVLIRGGLEGAAWDGLRASWSKDTIGATHPDVRLKTSSIPYAEVFWMAEPEQTLGVQEYIDQVMTNVNSNGQGNDAVDSAGGNSTKSEEVNGAQDSSSTRTQ